MKLLPMFVFAILMVNACTLPYSVVVRADELVHGTGSAEGTSTDNHHAIPRPEYDSWSSPGNMPGYGHDIGSEEAKP
ncbi:hypothetical protein ACP70R_011994 [Stipagrostis hirtigluma subsp. patula]